MANLDSLKIKSKKKSKLAKGRKGLMIPVYGIDKKTGKKKLLYEYEAPGTYTGKNA